MFGQAEDFIRISAGQWHISQSTAWTMMASLDLPMSTDIGSEGYRDLIGSS
jgi:hypothetical protein